MPSSVTQTGSQTSEIEQKRACKQMAGMVMATLKSELKGLYDYDIKHNPEAYKSEQVRWAKALFKRKAHQLVSASSLSTKLSEMGFELTQRDLQSKKSVLDYLLGCDNDGLDDVGAALYGMIAEAGAKRRAARVAHSNRLMDQGKREKDLAVGAEHLSQVRKKLGLA